MAAQEVSAKKKGGFGPKFKAFALENTALLALLILVVLLLAVAPTFRQIGSIGSTLVQTFSGAIFAFAMTFALAEGGIDLSITAIAALSAMTTALLSLGGTPAWISILAGVLVGTLFGVFNGFLNAVLKLPSFIATLASASIARGITLIISGEQQQKIPDVVIWLGSGLDGYMPVIIMFVMMALGGVILKYTTASRSIFAVGGNMEAARLSGISVRKTQFTVFILSGLFAAVAGVLLSGYNGIATPNMASTNELNDAIAAAVIGGASMSGGKGKVTGSLFGALVIQLINIGLNLMNVSSDWQNIAIGFVIAAAVAIDTVRRKQDVH